MILTDILIKNSKDFANKPALTMQMGYRKVTLTYKEVYDLSCRIALFLQKNGIKKGDKILIFAPNSPYWICVFWAILLCGAIAVPLNIQSTFQMIKKIAEQTDGKIIFKSRFFKIDIPQDIKSYDIEFIDDLVENFDCSDFQMVEVLQDDLIEILYTSGTTGDPKGVMLTHKNISANLEVIPEIFNIRKAHEKILSILPLSHIFEQTIGFFLTYMYAAHIIYTHSYASILDLMQEYSITKMLAVPEFLKVLMSKIKAAAEKRGNLKSFEKMLSFSKRLNNKFVARILFRSVHKRFGKKLDTIACGGAFLDPELEKEWRALGISLLQGYGLTETSPLISCNSYTDHKFGSVGKVVRNVKLKIDDTGQVLVKGPNVFQGYFKNEEKTKESFTHDGLFKTADMGYLDKDDFLYLKGRQKYLIIGPGAQNIYPEDIELELNNIDGVKDSCVVGLENHGGALEIHAVLLLRQDTLKPEGIIEEANKHLASYQNVTGWSVWPDDDFPRSATRKVKKEEVLKWLKTREENGFQNQKVFTTSPLKKILGQITGIDDAKIHEETKIIPNLKMDSLTLVELVVRIEDELNVQIDQTKITSKTTVADLQEIIDKKEPVKKLPPLKKWPRSWWAFGLRSVGRSILFSSIRIFVNLKVEGKENLKDLPLPAIFMPNHLSYLDPLVLMMALPSIIRRKVAFAAGRDVMYEYYWYLSFFADLLGTAFPLPRLEGEDIRSGLEYMGQFLDLGYSVVAFPEGRMSVTGKLQQLKQGAGFVAVEMDVCVVPVKIVGTEEVVPYGKFRPRKRGEVIIRFGKPIKFKKSDSYTDVKEVIQKALQSL